MRMSVICPSEIAIRRFMPALSTLKDFEFAGVGICSANEMVYFDGQSEMEYEKFNDSQIEKACSFTENYGGRIFQSYEEAVTSSNVDAVYLPLPPALHYKWAKTALENGKHVLVEKPSTLSSKDTSELIKIAEDKKLALHENYMFIFHSQLDAIDGVIQSGDLGDVRLYRISFGFPRRAQNDFRYRKRAGGGALLDVGGYTMKYASKLLGNSARLVQAQANFSEEFEVDIFGTAVMTNDKGTTAQLAFGMDNDYKCELEVWGSNGTLYTNRVFTAPVGFSPTLRISKNGSIEEKILNPDDAFKKSIQRFRDCVLDENIRKNNVNELYKQSQFVDEFRRIARLDMQEDIL